MQHTRILAKRGAAARRELEDESSRPAHGRAGGSCRRHYRCHILGSCLSLIGVLQTSPFSVFMNYRHETTKNTTRVRRAFLP